MKKMKLQDCCIFISDGDHQAPPKSDKGVPFITISNITTDNRIDFSNVMYVPLEYYEQLSEKSKAIKNDILYSVVGSFGKPVLIEEDRKFVFQRHIAILRPNLEKVIPEFLYYTLLNPQFYTVADYLAIGAAQRTISLESLRNIEIELPSLSQQKRIVDVIAPIDKKIHENAMINDYLEEMAKTIYDYWFVQFDFPNENGKSYKSSGGALLYNEVLKKEIPFGWTIDTLGNLLSKVPNSTKIPAIDFYDKGSIPVIDQSSDFIAGYTDDETSVLYNKTGYIVFGDHTRVVKYIRFPFARGADGTQIINSNTRCMPNELFYQVIKSIDLSNYGYARHFKYLKDTIIVIPSANLADIYAEKVGKWYENQVSIMKENNALSQLRDWLLPMLMNGQATIED